jgi:hypothetical protein
MTVNLSAVDSLVKLVFRFVGLPPAESIFKDALDGEEKSEQFLLRSDIHGDVC